MKKDFKGLDIVRTLLALSVAVGHFLWVNGVKTHYPRSFFLAVDFFFILSGFVLAQSVFYNPANNAAQFIKKFIVSRVFRLYPLYFVTGSPLFIYFALKGASMPLGDYSISLLLLQGVGVADTKFVAEKTVSIAWSISVELWGGIVFFPIVFFLRNKRRELLAVCLATAAAMLAILMVYSHGWMDVTIDRLGGTIAWGMIRGFLGFALGVICYLAYLNFGNLSWRTATIMEVVLLSGYAILYWPAAHIRNFEFEAPLVLTAILFVLATERGAVGSALASGTLDFTKLRHLSYAIYLIHPGIITLYRIYDVKFSHAGLPIYIALILAASYPAYYLIERPMINLGRRLLRPKPSPVFA
jgi:peptidoglycan/LPS O-acetylase OafA/YrhL